MITFPKELPHMCSCNQHHKNEVSGVYEVSVAIFHTCYRCDMYTDVELELKSKREKCIFIAPGLCNYALHMELRKPFAP